MKRMYRFLFLFVVFPGALLAQAPAAIRPSDSLLASLNATTALVTSDTLRLCFCLDSVAKLGRPIDQRLYGEIVRWYRGRIFRGEPDLFGIARVPLGDGVLAYIVRTPSQVASTAIDIWPFDSSTGLLGPPIRVADSFGNPGWFFRTDAWLVDLDADGVRDIVQRRRDAWEDDETGDKHRSDSLFVFLRRERQFQRRQVSTAEHLLRTFDILDFSHD